MKYGKLEIESIAYIKKYKSGAKKFVNCLCECGNKKIISLQDIKSGKTRSCGCIFKKQLSDRNKKHGFCGTRFYRCYRNIVNRCCNEKNSFYKNYGGRGIKNLWESFESFKLDMYESYLEHCKIFGEKNTTIDRIDVDLNYCKENCRWATILEQNYNKKQTIIYYFDGKKLNTNELSNILGLKKSTILSLNRKGILPKNMVSYYEERIKKKQ